MAPNPHPDPAQICFGLSQDQDRFSCRIFLQLLGRPESAELLSSRLSSAEIDQLVDLAARLLRTHFTEQEYHQVFLRGTDRNTLFR